MKNILILAALVLAIASCKKEKAEPEPDITPAKIAGRWKLTETFGPWVGVQKPANLTETEYTKDGKYRLYINQQLKYDGTYSISTPTAAKNFYTLNTSDQNVLMIYKIKTDTLFLSQTYIDGGSYTYVRQK